MVYCSSKKIGRIENVKLPSHAPQCSSLSRDEAGCVTIFCVRVLIRMEESDLKDGRKFETSNI